MSDLNNDLGFISSEVDPIFSSSPASEISSDDIENWDSKQSSLGYTPENILNKENSTLDDSTSKYPTNNLVKTNLELKANLLDLSDVAFSGNMSDLNNNDSYVQDEDYVHTDNNLTDSLKSNYDTAYTNNHTHSNKLDLDQVNKNFTITYNNGQLIQKTYSSNDYITFSYNLDDTINQIKYYTSENVLYNTKTAQYSNDLFIGWI